MNLKRTRFTNLDLIQKWFLVFFFQGLRMNRTLLSLNLGSNLIGDNGASKLAEVRKFFS